MALGCVRDAHVRGLCLGLGHCFQKGTVVLVRNQNHRTLADRSPQDHSEGLHIVDLQ